MLHGKKILLGVTGSIAAYKSAFLIRLLVKAGAEVRVIMTQAAKEFITPLTLSTISKYPVVSDFVRDSTGLWNNHVELGLWADAYLIAPASANTLAKMAHGMADNLLIAVYLSARCPVVVAPAMDLDMWQHGSTTENLNRLKDRGNHVIQPGYGELASGLVGTGRMAEPEELLDYLSTFFGDNQSLKGKVALVTAGPTYEAIDPVRYIGNHSTGKMGFAIAETLARKGATVHLVTGPTQLHTEQAGVIVTRVTSAEEMHKACIDLFSKTDIAVMAAAVADYKPVMTAGHKIKKKADTMTVELEKTPDIAASLGKVKKPNQLVVGFALETENETENAIRKLEAKNFDLIVLNSLRDEGAGFGYDTNKISIIDRSKRITSFDLKSKKALAEDIVAVICENVHA